MTHHVDLSTVVLARGDHEDRTPGEWCVMEAVAYFAHEPWSDHPACVSPVVGAFLRCWNDDLDDEGRQMLVPYIPRVVGTDTGPADDERRGWLVTDWMVRTYLPAWLRLAGLGQQASAVEASPALASPADWGAARPQVDAARKDAAAARDAARDAAWAAARDAARAAAGAAARDAARDAARAAAGDAAGAAAGAAAWAAAGAAAWAAAGAAAGAALRPTVVGLQASALDLLDRLITVGAEPKAV